MHQSNWGLFFDYNYLDVSGSGFKEQLELTVDFTSTLVEAGGLYRFGKGSHAFDLLGGVRYTKLEPSIKITSPVDAKLSRSEDWCDPIVGVRYV